MEVAKNTSKKDEKRLQLVSIATVPLPPLTGETEFERRE
jgi:hypothetical protein